MSQEEARTAPPSYEFAAPYCSPEQWRAAAGMSEEEDNVVRASPSLPPPPCLPYGTRISSSYASISSISTIS
eukprot:COSAG03_NODE_4007_length_1724_cov_4.620308_3_plen_71_part_01